jgi:hypothetical protein
MAHRTIDGQPRTSRRDRTYDHTPLPTMADKLLFILTYFTQISFFGLLASCEYTLTCLPSSHSRNIFGSVANFRVETM